MTIKNHMYSRLFFNSEMSESFAVGNKTSVKIKTYGIYCPYR